MSWYKYAQKQKKGRTNANWELGEHFLEEKMFNVTLEE